MQRVALTKRSGGRFAKGSAKPPNSGRQPGRANRHTRVLREAIILAAEAVGEDGKGKGKLVGYLARIAKRHPEVFCTALLAKELPYQLQLDAPAPAETITMSEAQERLRADGIHLHYDPPAPPPPHVPPGTIKH